MKLGADELYSLTAGKLQMEGEMTGPARRLAIRAVVSLGDVEI